MGDMGNDQGGRWPVGIWFAMVGVSAGTVASFSLIGWTFARDLYGGGGAEPLGYEPQTVVIEGEKTPDPVGVAGGDEPIGPALPGPEPQIAVSPAEPRAERLQDAEVEAARPTPERPRDEPVPESSTPPQLVPIGEDEDPCDPGEDAGEPDWDPYDPPELVPVPDIPAFEDVFEEADFELELEFDLGAVADAAADLESDAAAVTGG